MSAPAGRRILVVDDYRDSAAASSLLLRMFGHECRSATSGYEALELDAEFQPEIVILDIGLPDLSGYDVARELRRRQGERALFLAAMTGWGQPDDRVRALAAGFDHHVLKPANAEKLREIVARADEAAGRAPTPRR